MNEIEHTLDLVRSGYKNAVRKAEVRGILLYLIHTKQTVTYLELAQSLGHFSGGKVLSGILGAIMADDASSFRALKSSIVVSSKTGVPSDGYFHQAMALGLLGENTTWLAWHPFWQDQMKALGVPIGPLAQQHWLGIQTWNKQRQQNIQGVEEAIDEIAENLSPHPNSQGRAGV